MLAPGSYSLDRASIKLDAYRLLAIFYANKEISRQSDPETRHDAASALEREFFAREMSRLLISIAIALRVLDDQINGLPPNDAKRQHYQISRNHVNAKYQCMMFDSMTLRDVCNKIIHANVVEPHFQEGKEMHKIDLYQSEESDEYEPVKWQHLTSNIRLGGKKNGEQWWHLLEVPEFVAAIVELLGALEVSR